MKNEMNEEQMIAATWLGYITAKHSDWVEFLMGYYEEQIAREEFPIPPTKFHGMYEDTIHTNIALGAIVCEAKRYIWNFLDSFEDDFDMELTLDQYDQFLEIGLDIWSEQYDKWSGFHSGDDLELQQWAIEMITGPDKVMNEVNDLLK